MHFNLPWWIIRPLEQQQKIWFRVTCRRVGRGSRGARQAAAAGARRGGRALQEGSGPWHALVHALRASQKGGLRSVMYNPGRIRGWPRLCWVTKPSVLSVQAAFHHQVSSTGQTAAQRWLFLWLFCPFPFCCWDGIPGPAGMRPSHLLPELISSYLIIVCSCMVEGIPLGIYLLYLRVITLSLFNCGLGSSNVFQKCGNRRGMVPLTGGTGLNTIK